MIRIEVTDGWYAIDAVLDKRLSQRVRNGSIYEGQKLCIQNMGLSGVERGVDPLECVSNNPESGFHRPYLTLCENSCRPASWDARMGYQQSSGFSVPLGSIVDGGGAIGGVEVYISRLFPSQYMERKGEATIAFHRCREQAQENVHSVISGRPEHLITLIDDAEVQKDAKTILNGGTLSFDRRRRVQDCMESARQQFYRQKYQEKQQMSPSQVISLFRAELVSVSEGASPRATCIATFWRCERETAIERGLSVGCKLSLRGCKLSRKVRGPSTCSFSLSIGPNEEHKQ